MVMGKLINLKGQKFVKWTVLEQAEVEDKRGGAQWICKCECGITKTIYGTGLRAGKTTQCYTCSRNAIRIDISGQKFGKWTVLEICHNNTSRKLWKCICECGNEKLIDARSLKDGRTTQCRGCYFKKLKYQNPVNATFINEIKERANKKGIEFNISCEILLKLFIQQNQSCFFCNRKIILLSSSKEYHDTRKEIEHVSVDRIDSSKGYVENNIQLACKACNIAKNTMTNKEFIKLCYNIVTKHNINQVNF